MSVSTVGSMQELRGVLQQAGNKAVVIDFYATWCGPCQAVAPQVESLAAKYRETSVFVKVDVDRAPDVQRAYSVSAMPTFHVCKAMRSVDTIVGADVGAVERAVQRHGERNIFTGSGQRLGSDALPAPSAAARRAAPPPREAAEVDPALFAELQSLGFADAAIVDALSATKAQATLVAAVDHLARTQEAAAASSSSPAAASTRAAGEVKGTLQLRFSDGSRVQRDVYGGDTVRTLWDAVQSARPDYSQRRFELLQTFPRQTFSQSDWDLPIEQTSLLPRSQLQVIDR